MNAVNSTRNAIALKAVLRITRSSLAADFMGADLVKRFA
jgi:hypothetical protein